MTSETNINIRIIVLRFTRHSLTDLQTDSLHTQCWTKLGNQSLHPDDRVSHFTGLFNFRILRFMEIRIVGFGYENVIAQIRPIGLSKHVYMSR